MKGTFRRIVAGILMIAMILPITALAAEYDLSNGDIKVDVTDEGQYVTQTNGNEIIWDNEKDDTPIVITQAENTTTSNTITVNASEGSQATVTIQDINIEAEGEAAIKTEGDVTIQISGENSVSSDGTAIDATGSLTITGAPDTEVTEEPAPAEDNGTEDTTTAEDAPIVPENSLTVEGENTAIDVDGANSSDGELIIGNGNRNDKTKGDIEVTAVGGEVGIAANVTVDDGYLNAWGDVYGNATDDGIGVDGNLTVEEGAAAVYGDDIGVNGDVTVGTATNTDATTQVETTPPVATAIIHTNSSGTPVGSNALTEKADGEAITSTNGYVPEYSNTMFYSMHSKSYSGSYPTYDIVGNYNGKPHSTTYSDDGYETYLKVGTYAVDYIKDFSGNTAYNGLNVLIEVTPCKGGQLLQISYTVTNKTSETLNFDLGSGADVKIGNKDSAIISPLVGNSGFMMVGDNESQFNFFGKGYAGVTDVDGFWYGRWSGEWYGSQEETVFKTTPSDNTTTGYDSAASWCWLDETIAGGEVKTYSVLIGIGGADSEDIAGPVDPDIVPDATEPEPTEPKPTEPEQKPVAEPAPAPSAPSSQLTIKLDTIKEVIDLASSTQDGKPMEKLEATSEMTSGKPLAPEDAIVVCKAETTADATVEDITKEDVAMAFTVAYLRKGVVSNLPGKVKLSIPAPADSLEGYVLVFVLENGKQIEIPYELIDGNVVFTTDRIGLYMIVKK